MQNQDNVVDWLVGLLALILLAVFFLSSGRPAWSTAYAGEPSVHRDQSYVNTGVYRQYAWTGERMPPVLYQNWDTSRALAPWYDIIALQLTLGLYDAMDEYDKEQQRATEKLLRQKRIDEWRKDGNNYILLSFFLAVIVLLFGSVFYADKRRRRHNG